MTATQPVVVVRDAGVSYSVNGTKVAALSHADLIINAGEIVALIGESGSGKTTLGQMIGAMLPDNATRTGLVELNTACGPVNVHSLRRRQLASYRWGTVAYVAQAALSAFNPVLRIKEHFLDTAAAHDVPGGQSLKVRAFELLTSVELDAGRVWSSYPHELSGGMRQRVLIALSLLCEPDLVILDEPTTALDVLTQAVVLTVIDKLRRSHNTAFLFISHDLGVAAEIADRIATMYAGRIVELADSADVVAAPQHHYTAGLLHALPTLTNSASLKAIPGSPPDMTNPPTGCPFHPRCAAATDTCRTDMPPMRGERHKTACWHPLHDLPDEHQRPPAPETQSGHRAVASLQATTVSGTKR